MPRRLVVHLNVDGVSEDMLYDALAAGRLPAMNEAFGGGLRTHHATTIAPSTTIPAQTSLMTGCWPRKTQVHSFRLLRRFDNPPTFFNFEDIDNAVGYYGYKLLGWPDGLLPQVSDVGTVDARIHPQATTVYEEAARQGLSSTCAFHMVMRGATRRILPRKATFIKYALAHEGYGPWHGYDQDLATFGVEDIEKNGLTDFSTWYLAGLDASGHYVGGLKAQEKYLVQSIEPIWADLFKAMQKQIGNDEVLFVLSSDHGHCDYAGDMAHSVGTKPLYEYFRSFGYKLVDEFAKTIEVQPNELSICSGLGKLCVYVRRGGGGWMDPPRLEEDILPIAQRFVDAQGYFGPYLGHMLVKDRSIDRYRVIEKQRKGWAFTDLEDYYGGKEHLFPDAIARLDGLYYADSPDLLVFPDDLNGYCFNDHAHPSGHGSLYAGCSYVPVLMAGSGVAAQEVTGARLIDVMPTAAAWMGVDMPAADGKVLWQGAEKPLAAATV